MAKKLAVVFGIIFVIVGILGFIQNPLIGPTGIFVTDAVHNIFHLLVGVVLLVVSTRGEDASGAALKLFGVVYLLLFVNGLITPDRLLGFITQNGNDTWLHLVLGVVLVIAGYMKSERTMMDQMAV